MEIENTAKKCNVINVITERICIDRKRFQMEIENTAKKCNVIIVITEINLNHSLTDN